MTPDMTSLLTNPVNLLHAGQEFLFPPHCRRIEGRLGILFPPILVLVLQAGLLLHIPPLSRVDPQHRLPSFIRWLLDHHAQALRYLLLMPVVVFACRMGFAHHFRLAPLSGSDLNGVTHVTNTNNFTMAMKAVIAIGKGIELAVLSEPSQLKFSDRETDDHKKDDDVQTNEAKGTPAPQDRDRPLRIARPPRPFFFPHTYMPLCVDLVTNFTGYGWEWCRGQPSKAGYATLVPPTKRFDRQGRRFILSRLFIVISSILTYWGTTFLIAHPRNLAAFDQPPYSGSFATQPFSHSRCATIFVRGFMATLTSISLSAFMNFYSAFPAVFSAIIDPRTQVYWDALPVSNFFASTSLHEAWGHRWHGFYKRVLYFNGYLPVYNVSREVFNLPRKIAQCVAYLSLFLLSGLMHEIGISALRLGTDGELHLLPTGGSFQSLVQAHRDPPCPPLDPLRTGSGANGFVTTKFFVAQGMGVIVEEIFQMITKKQVKGILGWMWTFAWLGFWGGDMYKTWADHGYFEPFLYVPNPHDFPAVMKVSESLLAPVFAFADLLAKVLP